MDIRSPFKEGERILFDGALATVHMIYLDKEKIEEFGKPVWTMAIEDGSGGADVWETQPGLWEDSVGRVRTIKKISLESIARSYIRSIIQETWGQNLVKVMSAPGEIDNADDEYDPDSLNPYNANDELQTVKASGHPKSQGAGVGKGSGPATGRFPGGKNQ